MGCTEYQLVNSISVYDDLEGSLVIVLGQRGRICRIRNSDAAFRLLCFLQHKTTISGIISHFPDLTESSLRKGLNLLLSLGIVEVVSNEQRDVRCLIIGCGSIGSHIFRQLSMASLESIVLADKDVVEDSNVFRQDYYPDDVGKRKIDVLASRPSNAGSVIPVYRFIDGRDTLVDTIKEYRINLVIQAADVPSTTGLAMLINEVSDICDVPYIINPGYMGGAMSLPEFFYSNDTYSYAASHYSVKGRRLLQFQKSKLSFRSCSELACLVAQQVDDYAHNRKPSHYGEKGYFDTGDHTWHTEQVIDAVSVAPTGMG